ncbi:hypothetical protein VP01_2182g2 [Puccinia sorghi]|uniref:Uncharacterized protein n=1 Tax=Puccinia sorghi TaxID=27349 RepID=A0A0L6VB65_9BASI|nr:hypothetical protein VP01_2182g2 [Puccinia sorghi]
MSVFLSLNDLLDGLENFRFNFSWDFIVGFVLQNSLASKPALSDEFNCHVEMYFQGSHYFKPMPQSPPLVLQAEAATPTELDPPDLDFVGNSDCRRKCSATAPSVVELLLRGDRAWKGNRQLQLVKV